MRARRRWWSWLDKNQVIDHVIHDINLVCSRAKVSQCDLFVSEFDFTPRGHIELGEELGLIRQR